MLKCIHIVQLECLCIILVEIADYSELYMNLTVLTTLTALVIKTQNNSN